ncbi:MAG: hypothetical protein UV61_C0008G0157 [Candidatus Gottesmanbacteria bacterium GW2011_GWB1_43_11]|uniref:Glycosyltransferase RgtA/B/C/D-like domain-containing protein n=1 Tax=Candidatus Gottesmanbacteria bacterium GW2011_GWB1_43_11 TaxID=1618446 RepID=A0A0G1CMG5_9BACT|nr:MAG: hypothetical protein UV04_C0009G0010 [Candidatus Gottesmanbacteria bacterium GW2011_GWA2_42_16]KKS54526.1 MAG: hypothetical protein UV17_C0017G0012 [Candidatus Gottesmanbacteria bacterium GW2011_GWA1_42_26]KKS81420.1 MAG: hypothetical protein UV55_C0014G0009 [Candidatus Gottesmanbacteria bacterium GW2011_GWC1_43_10]KKS86704.1 MAG: hypothetical protein UV61_C0008G0157 [Candidatus Gottesmanbacteria bacterium GW2011_GWB1_43_11]OGG07525.1 MAG: hypothetical protein A2699_05600 [Candidatus Go
MKLILLVFVLIFGYWVLAGSLLTKTPPVWTDEAIYADMARNFLQTGHLEPDLNRIVSTTPNYTYYYPPLFFYVLSAWFRFVPLTIESQRLFSLLLGSLFTFIFIALIRRFLGSRSLGLTLMVVAGMFLDNIFLSYSRFSRPEMLLLVFWGLSLYFFWPILKVKTQDQINSRQFLLSGLFASLAFLSHYIGIFIVLGYTTYFVITQKWRFLKSKKFYLLIAGFILPATYWLLIVLKHFSELQSQIYFLGLFKHASPWSFKRFLFEISPNILVGPLYLTVIMMNFVDYVRFKHKQSLLIAISFVWVWILIKFMNNITYYLLFVPMVYLGLINMLDSYSQNKFFKMSLLLLLALLFFNSQIFLEQYSRYGGESYSYEKFTDKLLAQIPDEKQVFLSVIPDPYHGFIKANRKNILKEYPTPGTDEKNYIELLEKSDYIIFNGFYGTPQFNQLLQNFMAENKNNFEAVSLNEPEQFQAVIFKSRSTESR